MKAIGYSCCILLLTCFLMHGNAEKSQAKIQQEFLDAFTTDETLKIKRPFCNAFTGCGKKRSFYESSTNSQDLEGNDHIRLPFSLYKALLKAASENVRKSIDRDANNYQSPEIPEIYISRKAPLRKRLEILSNDLD